MDPFAHVREKAHSCTAPARVLSKMCEQRNRYLIGALCVFAFVSPEAMRAESLNFRSGDAGHVGSGVTLTCYAPDDAYPFEVSPTIFSAARNGQAPRTIDTLMSWWLPRLAADTEARWINEDGRAPYGDTALYAITFNLIEPFADATLELFWAVDDQLGYSHGSTRRHGVYINEVPIENSIGGLANVEVNRTWINVGSSLHVGQNTIYLYSCDREAQPAGIIFSGVLRTSPVQRELLFAQVEGRPLFRNNIARTVELSIYNDTPDTAFGCIVFVETDSRDLELVADFVPFGDTPDDSVTTVISVDDHQVLRFIIPALPAHSSLRGLPLRLVPHNVPAGGRRFHLYPIVMPLRMGDDKPIPYEERHLVCGTIAALQLAGIGMSPEQFDRISGCFVNFSNDFLVFFWRWARDHGCNSLYDCFTAVDISAWWHYYQQRFLPTVMRCTLGFFPDGAIRGLVERTLERMFKTAVPWMAAYDLYCASASYMECIGERPSWVPACVDLTDLVFNLVGVRSLDPNCVYGPASIEPSNPVNVERYDYYVAFENNASASVAANIVTIVDTLDVMVFDLESVTLEDISLRDRHYKLEISGFPSQNGVDLRPDVDLLVNVFSRIDPSNGTLTTILTGIDPATGEPPLDDRGVIAPNRVSPEGEGCLHYSVRLLENIENGTYIGNQAAIQFDAEPWIATEEWSNTVDQDEPTATITDATWSTTDSTLTISLRCYDPTSTVRRAAIYRVEESGTPGLIGISDLGGSTTMHIPMPFDVTGVGVFALGQDAAGNWEYLDSDVEYVVNDGMIGASTEQPRVMPVPTTGEVSLSCADCVGDCSVSLYDLRGRQIGSTVAEWPANERVNFELADLAGKGGRLACGRYFIRVTCGKKHSDFPILYLR